MSLHTPRPLWKIAAEIKVEWPSMTTNPNHPANPYWRALTALSSVRDMYGHDSAESVILYFLTNSASWRGDVARRIKTELRAMVGRNENNKPRKHMAERAKEKYK